LKRCLDKSEGIAKKITNQRIFLFLGDTGVGKSTTICYLSFCRMVSANNHIDALLSDNSPTKSCKISHSVNSETRFLNPVFVSLKGKTPLFEENIILCDTPGFRDTHGPEVDISNSLNIVKGIQGARAVKPIVIISKLSLGAKYEELINLITILMGMIPKIEKYLRNFYYLFTHFENNEKEAIEAKLNLLYRDVESRNIEKKGVILAFIEDLKKKVKIVQPLDGKPQEILKDLLDPNSSYIEYPEEVFQNSVSLKSRYDSREQAVLLQNAIRYYMRIKEYEMANFKFCQLKYLTDLLPNLKDFYEIDKAKKVVLNYYKSFVFDYFAIKNYDVSAFNLDENLENVLRLFHNLKKIEEAESFAKLHQHINSNRFSSIKEDVFKKIGVFFNKINDEIKEGISSNKNYEQLKNFLQNFQGVFQLIQKIKQDSASLSAYLKNVFQDLYGTLKQFVNKFENDVKIVLNDIQSKKEKIDYKKLKKALDCLSENKWIGEVIPRDHETIIGNIDEEIANYFDEKKEEFYKLELILEKPENLQVDFDLIFEINKMKEFKNLFEFIEKDISGIIANFRNSVDKIFEPINREKHFLDDIHKMELIFQYLDSFSVLKNGISEIKTEKARASQILREFLDKINTELDLIQINSTEFCNEILKSSIKPNFNKFLDNLINFLHRIKKISLIENLSQNLNIKSRTEACIQTIIVLYNELKTVLISANFVKDCQIVLSILTICKKLAPLDEFLDKKYNFDDLYNEQRNLMIVGAKGNLEKCINCLKTHDYLTIKLILEKEKKFDEEESFLIKENFREIRENLAKHLESLIEGIYFDLKNNKNKFIIPKEIYRIFDNFTILKKANSCLKDLKDHLQNLQNPIDDSCKTFEDLFYKIFVFQIEEIKKEFANSQYQRAEEHLKDLLSVSEAFSNLLEENATKLDENIRNLEQNRNAAIEGLFLSIKQIEFEDFYLDIPKERYESLKKISLDVYLYHKISVDYHRALKDKINEKLHEIENSFQHEEKELQLNALKNILYLLPETIDKHFQIVIQKELIKLGKKNINF